MGLHLAAMDAKWATSTSMASIWQQDKLDNPVNWLNWMCENPEEFFESVNSIVIQHFATTL